LTHVVQVWQVYVLALLVGVARVFEIPARQTFLLEMVGPEHIRNAVGLNSVIPNGARAIGPAIAGVTIATVGVGICFIINAASFIAIVVMLLTLDVDRLTPSQPAGRSPGQLREGVRYVLSSPVLVVPMLMTALIGCFSIQWLVALPILASGTFHGGPRTYGFMMGAVGTGAVIGALLVARRGRTGLAPLVTYAALLGIALLAATLAPVLPLEFIALVSYGLCAVTFTSSCNATVQLASAPQMRGRVIALWLVGLDGLNPIGAPTIGAVGGIAGGRWALAVGAAAALAATCVGAFALRARRGLSPSLATDVAALMTELA
jgi:MFS family permease